jgi:hypothetical protein
MGKDPKPWFGAKRSGVGFRPQTWQGWIVILVVLAAFILFRVAMRH